jgi:hypothetical protein
VGGEAPVTPVSSPDSSPWTFPTNRAITRSKGLIVIMMGVLHSVSFCHLKILKLVFQCESSVSVVALKHCLQCIIHFISCLQGRDVR